MSNRKFFAIVLPLLAIGSLANDTYAQEERMYVNPRTPADEGVPPYSGAVRVGDTLYVSGSSGLDENGEVPDDPVEEARLVMSAIKRNVEAAGMTMDDIVYIQVFCSDVSHYNAFNEAYRTFFTREYPARAFLGAGTLLANARYEVQGIAVKR